MTASCVRHLSPALWGLLCTSALGCGEGQGLGAGPEPEARLSLPALILSNPSIPDGLDSAGSRAALVDPVVYASLPPGSVPDGALALFTNMATGAGATAMIVAGGFDPVPIPATAGDSLQLRIQLAGGKGERFFYAKAPPRRSPRVVRSDPAPGRSDVPLNSRVFVVFSEPMSVASISDSTVYLSRNELRVPGTLDFADSAHVTLVFTPESALAPSASHTLHVSSTLTDRDGDALELQATVPFVTAVSGDVPNGTQSQWEALAAMPQPRSSAGVVVRNGIVYVLGGYSFFGIGGAAAEILAYDPVRNAWRTAGTLTYPVAGPGVAVVGERIYVIGGYVPEAGEGYVSHVQIFDPISGSVFPGPPLPEARFGVAAAVVDGRIHVFGGEYTEPGFPIDLIDANDHFVLDPVAGTWSTRAPMSSGQSSHSAVVIGRHIYVVAAGTVERYDAANDSWTFMGASTYRYGAGVTALGGAIYIAGGEMTESQRTSQSASVVRFDPATRSFTRVPDMMRARALAGFVTVDGAVHAIGGLSTGGEIQASVERLRPAP
jgi:hypothetical protein